MEKDEEKEEFRVLRFEDRPVENSLKLHAFFTLTCVFSVVTLHYVQGMVGWDPLAIAWVNGSLVSIDSWSVIHVITFACIGYLYPRQTLQFMMYGALWELIEWGLATGPISDFWTERGVNSAWDIWFNLVGYRLGESLLAYKINQEIRRERRRSRQAKRKNN